MTNTRAPEAPAEKWRGIPPRRSRAVDVAAYLSNEIRIRGLEPGARVGTAPEIQQVLGVAKSTVAEAVKILVDRGLIYAKTGPKGGLFVASQEGPERLLRRYFVSRSADATTAAEIMAVRDHLEDMLALDVLRSARETDFAAMGSVLDDMEAASPGDFITHVWQFHRLVAESASNRTLGELYVALLDAMIESVVGAADLFAGVGPAEHHRNRVAAHRALLKAIADRDEDALSVALTAHRG